jgi:hypothetical protein
LVESANVMFPVDQMTLQNPVRLPALMIQRTHMRKAVRVNVERHLIAGGLLSRDTIIRPPGEHNDGHGAAELPEALAWLWRDYDPAKTSQEFLQEPAEKDQPVWRVVQLNRK